MARFPDGYVMIVTPTETKLENGNVVINVDVDNRELVMCKHCKYAQHDVMFKSDIWCEGIRRRPDWFCADGEQKDA